MQHISEITGNVAYGLIALWLQDRNDPRTVEKYILDGHAGLLQDHERVPYDKVSRFI